MEKEKFEFRVTEVIEEGNYKIIVKRNDCGMTVLSLGGEGSKGFGNMRLYLEGGDEGIFDYRIKVSLGYVNSTMELSEVYEIQNEISEIMKIAEKVQVIIDNIEH